MYSTSSVVLNLFNAQYILCKPGFYLDPEIGGGITIQGDNYKIISDIRNYCTCIFIVFILTYLYRSVSSGHIGCWRVTQILCLLRALVTLVWVTGGRTTYI